MKNVTGKNNRANDSRAKRISNQKIGYSLCPVHFARQGLFEEQLK